MNKSFFILATLSIVALVSAQAENLLKNADFATATDGIPAEWKPYGNLQKLTIDNKETHGAAKQSLRVEIVADGGKTLGQIVQKVSVTPNSKYVFKLDMKSSVDGTGVGQIKLLVGSSELGRLPTAKSSSSWKTIELPFDSGEANVVWVVLRYDQEEGNKGQKIWFANPVLSPAS